MPCLSPELAQKVAPSHSPLQVLIVEDNEDAAESLRQMLELVGFHTLVARTGPQGIEMAEAECPDVILCDIGLPGCDGYEVARRIRSGDRCPDVLMVAVTGYGLETDRRNAFEAGFNVHVTKPADPRALVRMLEAVPSWLEAKQNNRA